MLKTLFISVLLIFLYQGCSSKKSQGVNYKTQQANSKEALKEL